MTTIKNNNICEVCSKEVREIEHQVRFDNAVWHYACYPNVDMGIGHLPPTVRQIIENNKDNKDKTDNENNVVFEQ